MRYLFSVALFAGVGCLAFFGAAQETAAAPNPGSYWKVDDVRRGMKGYGRTVMKGTKIESFQAEVLGVLRNTSPGRDMILCRLSGLGLEKTGVIAGMSGSPIYIDNKLLGAVAYAWPFGTEPIAGITPFSQMEKYVAAYESQDLADKAGARRIGLLSPLRIGGKRFDSVTVSDGYEDAHPASADGIYMVPLRTPLISSGFSTNSLDSLRKDFAQIGMVPMQGGAVGANIQQDERNITLEPGGVMAVSLIAGDFDMSGIGTVTHIEGKRVYGFGHPFFGIGSCDFPLSTGYTHTIYPRRSISFKMGSPLRRVGVVNADVSTCIAGWLDREADMLPMTMHVLRKPGGKVRTFNVEIARQRSILGTLIFTALSNSIDMEGELPEDLTGIVKVVVDIEGRDPIVLHDFVSGDKVSGPRAPQALYSQVQSLTNILLFNSFGPVRINRIECTTEIQPGRRTADIVSVELESESYAPGDTLKALVTLRPFKGLRQRIPLSLKLPSDLPEGKYTASVSDGLNGTRNEIRDNPNLANPPDLQHLYKSLTLQTGARRNDLVLRVPTRAVGVALGGKSLPDLPPSMVQILGETRRTGVQNIKGALVTRHNCEWVIEGSDTISFTVSKDRTISTR